MSFPIRALVVEGETEVAARLDKELAGRLFEAGAASLRAGNDGPGH